MSCVCGCVVFGGEGGGEGKRLTQKRFLLEIVSRESVSVCVRETRGGMPHHTWQGAGLRGVDLEVCNECD